MSPLRVLSGTFGALVDVLGSASVVLLLVAFFLVRREDLRDRFVHLIGRANLTVTTQALEDAATRVSHYLSTESLYFIGVPNAVLWGMAATTLRYIPYLGPILAAILPLVLSMAISTNWVAPILTAGLFVVVELTFNNVLEPWLYGKNTGVSAVAVLVAAVFWTWLWGSVGLLLATPLTVCLLVVGKHVPQLSFLNILLGSERVFDLKTRVYQRLLAGDVEESDDLIKEALTTRSLAEVYDTVLIPALDLAESDRRSGNIDAIRQDYIFQSLKDTVADLGERQRELPAIQMSGNDPPTPAAIGLTISPPLAKPCILLMPARDDADEIAARMLGHLIEASGFRAETISETALAGGLGDLIAERRADVVCISAMPPGAARQTRYLCKRLQGRLPDERLIVGLWNSREDLGKARTRVGCSEAVRLVSTLAQAHVQIQIMVQSLPVQPQPPDQSDIGRRVPNSAAS
jgi:hypothetical protein